VIQAGPVPIRPTPALRRRFRVLDEEGIEVTVHQSGLEQGDPYVTARRPSPAIGNPDSIFPREQP
jgi:hypothetical protein